MSETTTEATTSAETPRTYARCKVGMKCEVKPAGRGVFYPAKVTGYGRCHNGRLTEVDVRIDDGFQYAAGVEHVTIITAEQKPDGNYGAIRDDVRIRRNVYVGFK